MFSLIISIIAIALVAALAAASVFYGGNAFKQGTAKADVSEFQNKGQQIAGAFTLAKADGYDPTSVAELTDGSLGGNIYLTQVPEFKGIPMLLFGLDPDFVAVTVFSQVCDEAVARGGQDAGYAPSSAETPNNLFGCDKTGLSRLLFYKVR